MTSPHLIQPIQPINPSPHRDFLTNQILRIYKVHLHSTFHNESYGLYLWAFPSSLAGTVGILVSFFSSTY